MTICIEFHGLRLCCPLSALSQTHNSTSDFWSTRFSVIYRILFAGDPPLHWLITISLKMPVLHMSMESLKFPGKVSLFLPLAPQTKGTFPAEHIRQDLLTAELYFQGISWGFSPGFPGLMWAEMTREPGVFGRGNWAAAPN